MSYVAAVTRCWWGGPCSPPCVSRIERNPVCARAVSGESSPYLSISTLERSRDLSHGIGKTRTTLQPLAAVGLAWARQTGAELAELTATIIR